MNGKISNQRVKFLIDTGASVTILNYKKYLEIPPENRPSISNANINLFTADKSPLTVYGKIKTDLGVFQYTNTEFEVILADIHGDGLLGMDS